MEYYLSDSLPPQIDPQNEEQILLSAHKNLSGAFRALRRYSRWATHGEKFRDSRVVAYITTNRHPDTVQADLDQVTKTISHKQASKLVAYTTHEKGALAPLTPLTPYGYPLPHEVDKDQARTLRQARATLREQAYREQAQALRDQEHAQLLATIDPIPQRLPQITVPAEFTSQTIRKAPHEHKRRQAFTVLPYAHPNEQPTDHSGRRISTHKRLQPAYQSYRRALQAFGQACIVTDREKAWTYQQILETSRAYSRPTLATIPIRVYRYDSANDQYELLLE